MRKLKQEAQELLDFGNSTEKARGYGMMQVIEFVEEKYVPRNKSITWNVEDFKMRAKQKEQSNWKKVYDKSKFKEALKMMIHSHDAEIGITWDTLDYWLDEHCKK